MHRQWAGLLFLLALAPFSTALIAEGVLDVGGDALLPPETDASLGLLAAFLPDAQGLVELRVASAVMEVRWFDRSFAEVSNPLQRTQVNVSADQADWSVTDAVLSLDAGGDQAGWLGLDRTIPRSHLNATYGLRLKASNSAKIGNADLSGDDPWYAFLSTHDGLALTAEGSGEWTYEGPIKIKLGGPDIVIEARENTTRIATGETRSEGPVGETRDRWAIISATNARVSLTTTTILEAIVADAQAEWDNESIFSGATGELRGPEGEFVADQGTVRITGSLAGGFEPRPDSAEPRMLAKLTGNIERTNLAAPASTQAPYAPNGPGIAAVLLIGIGLALAVGVPLAKRRAPRRAAASPTQPPLSADDCQRMADGEVELEHYESALDWIERAKQLAPTSSRLCLDEGYILEGLGRWEEAKAAYRNAASLSPNSGEPELFLARMNARLGVDREGTGKLVARALDKSPILLLDIEGDEALSSITSDASVKAAIRRARQKLE